jgi:predicted nucleic acid-binding protein
VIVVDSSVWINQLRRVATRGTTMLREQLDPTDLLLGDLVLLEVLQGCRTEAEAERTERILRQFDAEEMLGLDEARQAAGNYRRLRQRGITVRSPIDVMIATFCIERGHELLTEDRDFQPMAQHLGLRLL